MRRPLLSAVAAALVAAAPSLAATRPSGLYGQVTKGPLTPVCRVGTPCTGPAAKVSIVFLRAGRPAVHATTNQSGRYRVALAAGRYTVRIAGGLRGSPTTARVPAGRFAHLDFSLDTGIR